MTWWHGGDELKWLQMSLLRISDKAVADYKNNASKVAEKTQRQ